MAGLVKGILLLAIAFPVWGTEEEIIKGLKRLKEEGLLSEEMERMIEEYREEVRELTEEVKKKALEEKEEKGSKERVYVFMSSSVPEEVWERYTDYVHEKGYGDRIVFLLRGCIGGCRYIRPTLEFLKKVIKEREVQVWIDPLKFREYGVKVVPCVAVESKKELSCGDWSLEYHLRKLGWLR